MRILKTLSALLFALVFIAAGFCVSYHWHNWQNTEQYTQGWSDRDKYLPPVEDIQKRIGAKVDGIWGQETNRLYEQAVCNQYAEQVTCSNVREFDRKMPAKVKK